MCGEGLARMSVFMSSVSYSEEERKHLLMLCESRGGKSDVSFEKQAD